MYVYVSVYNVFSALRWQHSRMQIYYMHIYCMHMVKLLKKLLLVVKYVIHINMLETVTFLSIQLNPKYEI